MPYELTFTGEVLDFPCDWSDILDDVGSPSDEISSSSWRLEPAGAGSPSEETVTPQATIGVVTNVLISGLDQAVKIYHLTNTIITSQGRTFSRTVTIRCANRSG